MTAGGGGIFFAALLIGRSGNMKKIRTLSIDIETYSDMDLQKCGVYKYAQSPAFEILLFGVSVNGGEVRVSSQKLPTAVLRLQH